MNEAARSEPTRTCVGCRQKHPQHELLRLAVVPEPPYLVPDARRKLGGRGVWIMPSRACVERAATKGGFARALHQAFGRGNTPKTQVDGSAVLQVLRTQLERRLEGLLGGGRRGRLVLVGTDIARESLREGRSRLLVFAHDAAGRRNDLERAAERAEVPVVSVSTKATLGAWLGRETVGVLSIEDEGLAAHIERVSRHLAGLRDPDSVPYEERDGGAREHLDRGDGGTLLESQKHE